MPKKRLGRGYGSGKGGHTSSRGQKGQKSRSGHKSLVFFEGGNVPLFRRLPKYRGMKSLFKIEAQPVNLDVIEKSFKDGDKVTMEILKDMKIVKKSAKQAKILGFGELSKKIHIEGMPVSETARDKILKAKGSVK